MKKQLLFSCLLCCSVFFSTAQAPNKFNYQAVAKDASGNPVTGTISVRFTVLDGSPTGAELYKELFDSNVPADPNGLFTLQIGTGTPLGNTSWGNINWSSGAKYIKTEIKPGGSSVYYVMGDPQQLVSVPYAQEAKGLDLPFVRTVPGDGELKLGLESMELRDYSANGTPFIDFAKDPGTDYDARIILSADKDFLIYTKGMGIYRPSGGYNVQLATAGIAGNFNGPVHIEGGDLTLNSNCQLYSDANGSKLELHGSQFAFIDFGDGFAGDFKTRIIYDNNSDHLHFQQADEYVFENGPIHAYGGKSFGNQTYVYYGSNCDLPIGCVDDDQPYAIVAEGRILTSEVNVRSDERIKNIIGESDAASDLDLLKKLQVKNYTHKDVIGEGANAKKGFVAQEVELVYPEAVSKGNGFIPDVYSKATPLCINKETQTMSMVFEKAPEVERGEKLRIIADQFYEVVVDAVDGNSVTVSKWTGPELQEIFVYGKEVDDFRTVDYDRLYTLNVSATQELARQVERLQQKNKELDALNLESQKRLAQLEAKMDTILQQSASADTRLGTSNQ